MPAATSKRSPALPVGAQPGKRQAPMRQKRGVTHLEIFRHELPPLQRRFVEKAPFIDQFRQLDLLERDLLYEE